MKFLKRSQLKPTMILDLGCGSMFISHSLASGSLSKYIGVDIMPAGRLKNRDAMMNFGIEKVEAIKASTEIRQSNKSASISV